MKLNKNGLIARFYEWSWEQGVPNDLCSYFWKLIIAAILSPFTATAFWVSGAPIGAKAAVGVVQYAILGYLSCVVISAVHGDWAPTVITAAVVVLMMGIALFISLMEGTISAPEFITEISGIIKERKRGFKDKYCPQIEWTEE